MTENMSTSERRRCSKIPTEKFETKIECKYNFEAEYWEGRSLSGTAFVEQELTDTKLVVAGLSDTPSHTHTAHTLTNTPS